jgi:chromosome segregation ATPase
LNDNEFIFLGVEIDTAEKIRGLGDNVQSKEQELLDVSKQLSETSSSLTGLTQNLQDKEQELAQCLETLGLERTNHELSLKSVETLTSQLSSTNARLATAEIKLTEHETRETRCNQSLSQQQEHAAQLEAKLEESIRETESLREHLNSTASSVWAIKLILG